MEEEDEGDSEAEKGFHGVRRKEEGGLVWKLESSVDNDIGDGRFWGDDVDSKVSPDAASTHSPPMKFWKRVVPVTATAEA